MRLSLPHTAHPKILELSRLVSGHMTNGHPVQHHGGEENGIRHRQHLVVLRRTVRVHHHDHEVEHFVDIPAQIEDIMDERLQPKQSVEFPQQPRVRQVRFIEEIEVVVRLGECFAQIRPDAVENQQEMDGEERFENDQHFGQREKQVRLEGQLDRLKEEINRRQIKCEPK